MSTPVTRLEVARQRLGQAAGPAPEVESAAQARLRVAPAHLPQVPLDLRDAGREELGDRPAVPLLPSLGEDCEERVALGEVIPVAPHLQELHGEIASTTPFTVVRSASTLPLQVDLKMPDLVGEPSRIKVTGIRKAGRSLWKSRTVSPGFSTTSGITAGTTSAGLRTVCQTTFPPIDTDAPRSSTDLRLNLMSALMANGCGFWMATELSPRLQRKNSQWDFSGPTNCGDRRPPRPRFGQPG